VNIPFEIILGDFDGGSPRFKKQGDMWLMHQPLSADEAVTISVSDDGADAYDTGREVSVKDPHSRLNRNGKFRRRNYKVSGDLSEQIRMESLHITVRV
jgi:hypothetical protein